MVTARPEKARSRSILDSVISGYNGLSGRLGVDDRRKIDQHLTQIRELEVSIGAVGTTGGFDVEANSHRVSR